MKSMIDMVNWSMKKEGERAPDYLHVWYKSAPLIPIKIIAPQIIGMKSKLN